VNRPFARLWTASLFSEIAEWMLQVALPVFIYQATGSAGSTALTMAAGIVPVILLSPVAGVVADRWDKRRTLWMVCVAQAVVALPLLFGGDAVIYVVMAAQASVAALFESTRSALLPELVTPERLVAANGLMGFNSSVARLLGSSLGGVILGFAGLVWVVLVYLAALVIAAALLLPRFPVSRTRVAEHSIAWFDGLREFRRSPILRFTGITMTLCSVAQGMFLVLFVLFVTGPLAGGEPEVGLFRGIQAVGGLAAGAVIASIARRTPPATMLGIGAVGLGLLALGTWNMPALTTADAVYIGLFAMMGAPSVFLTAGMFSVLQTNSDPSRAGRVLAAFIAVMSACQVLGMLLTGSLVDVWGLTTMLDIQAALIIVAGVTFLLCIRPVAARRPDRESAASA
jgi:predicted MFS family arabinose efflux permease